MNSRIQSRFFDIMRCYQDDERLAASAIFDFHMSPTPPEEIYLDLLSCNYARWIYQLEFIADTTLYIDLREYCLNKSVELDMMRSKLWSCGDSALIEKEAWRLAKEEE